MTYFFVVIFLPLTKRVDVDVLLIAAVPPFGPLNELLNVENDVKPFELLENKSSMPFIPIPKPNGLKNCDAIVFCCG